MLLSQRSTRNITTQDVLLTLPSVLVRRVSTNMTHSGPLQRADRWKAYARAMKEVEDSPEHHQAMKKKEEALQRGSSGFTEGHREPILVHVAIEREVTVSGGPIGFPEGRFVEQSEPERQSRRLPGKRNVYQPQE